MSDDASLVDILTYGRRAMRAAKEKEAFLDDEVAQSAVAYCLSVMGEAVKRISPQFQQGHPEVNWSDIAKMRDLLVHAYHRVDWNLVWDTVKTSIPETVRLIEILVPPEES
jgi:uncharacterized protein with HEPN domain